MKIIWSEDMFLEESFAWWGVHGRQGGGVEIGGYEFIKMGLRTDGRLQSIPSELGHEVAHVLLSCFMDTYRYRNGGAYRLRQEVMASRLAKSFVKAELLNEKELVDDLRETAKSTWPDKKIDWDKFKPLEMNEGIRLDGAFRPKRLAQGVL